MDIENGGGGGGGYSGWGEREVSQGKYFVSVSGMTNWECGGRVGKGFRFFILIMN